MKIAFINSHQDDLEKIKQHYQSHEVLFFSDLLIVPDDIDIISLSHNDNFGIAELKRFTNLKLIQTRSTGFNHIDFKSANENSIVVVNVPSYHPASIAEFTFTLILGLARNLNNAHTEMKINKKASEDLRGVSLSGKTLGLIGTGHIGKKVLAIASGFGMEVIGFDPYPDHKLLDLKNFSYTKDLNFLAQNSDIISLHAPATNENYHLINKDFLKNTKKDVFIINTARGSLVDGESLLEFLNSGHIKGAGLDVLEFEEDLCLDNCGSSSQVEIKKINEMIINHPKVITTPHVAYFTKEAQDSILELSFEGIDAFIQGKPIYQVF